MTAGASVTVTDLNANKLTFDPAADANGAAYTSFTFQVADDGGTVDGEVDLVLDGGTVEDGLPSTLVDCSTKYAAVLRVGAVELSAEEIDAR